MKILVTGGAGFIGSITTKYLLDKGYDVIVYDSLVKGHKDSIDPRAIFIHGCLSNKELLDKTFQDFNIKAVIHFAGFIEAGESMKQPEIFFENNIINSMNLLNSIVKNKIKKIIYSSSAGVYAAKDKPIVEGNLKEPVNFYGETKLIFERILKWYDQIYGIKSISLRYFNAYGNFEELGENHMPETHLIPLTILTAMGKKDSIKIYGHNYPTLDGTCIRDYIHVKDLAEAHLLALENLKEESKIYNVGTGKGVSVREVIDLVKEITGNDFKVIEEQRRLGDPAILVADSNKIKKELGWSPRHNIKQGLKETIKYFQENLNKI